MQVYSLTIVSANLSILYFIVQEEQNLLNIV